ncbi:hypothetical protein P609_08820 [Comamonas thiooxydans]|nr:hypothetical protein P609_08820 [Comamonas thiooxydans]
MASVLLALATVAGVCLILDCPGVSRTTLPLAHMHGPLRALGVFTLLLIRDTVFVIPFEARENNDFGYIYF